MRLLENGAFQQRVHILSSGLSRYLASPAFVTTDTSEIFKCGLLCPEVLAVRTGNSAWDSATPDLLKAGIRGERCTTGTKSRKSQK